MNETFKINVYFDEKGEEIEKLISNLLVDMIEKNRWKIFITSAFEFIKKLDIIKKEFKSFYQAREGG